MRWFLAGMVLLAGCAATEPNYPVARFEGSGSPKAVAACIYDDVKSHDPLSVPLKEHKGKSYRVWDDPELWGSFGTYDIEVTPGTFGSVVVLRSSNTTAEIMNVIKSCLDG
jgi:hypothetical protein